MKIKTIKIQNFLRIRSLDLRCETPVQLIAGPNEAGKSSLAEAIRFLVFGDSPRVRYKKDYGELVSRGARQGSVTLSTSAGDVTRALPEPLLSTNGTDLVTVDDAPAQIALGAASFVDLGASKRRELLFELVDVDISRDAVIERLQRRAIDAGAIEQVLPLLRGGFELAHKQAKANITEARADWKASTGEAYGAKKAEHWQARQPGGVDEAALKIRHRELAAARAKIDAANRALGAARQGERTRRELRDELKGLSDAASAPLEARAGKLIERIGELEQALARAPDNRARRAPLLHCPECNAALHLVQDRLVPGEAGQAGVETEQRPRAELERTLEAERKALGAIERDIDRCEAKQRRRAEIEKKLNAENEGPEVGAIEQEIANGQAEARALEEKLRELEADARAGAEAKTKTEHAAKHHARVKQWTELAGALAPDGIPGELLSEALDPINARLRQSAEIAGWKPVRIDPDMTVVRADGITYALLSDSAKWRAGAMLADAIARTGGVGNLILDRMDVLEVADRPNLLRWLESLAGEYGTIFVMATLKSAPRIHNETISSHWLEAGAELLVKRQAA